MKHCLVYCQGTAASGFLAIAGAAASPDCCQLGKAIKGTLDTAASPHLTLGHNLKGLLVLQELFGGPPACAGELLLVLETLFATLERPSLCTLGLHEAPPGCKEAPS